MLLKTAGSGKEERRMKVHETHEVILLLGDNLSDFHHDYDDKSTIERNRLTDSLYSVFGPRYIVLPNPMYGDWETDGIYEGSRKWTEFQKTQYEMSN